MPRRNDPLGLPDRPNIVTDPVRVAEIGAEAVRQVDYIKTSYHISQQLGLNRKNFNASLVQLRQDSYRNGATDPDVQLNPWLKLAIGERARQLAGLGDDDALCSEHQYFRDEAAAQLARTVKGIRGPRGTVSLLPTVEGIMAVWQEATGTPIMGPRDQCSVYDPCLRGKGGQLIRIIIDELEPNIPDRTIAKWIRQTRTKFAGKPMRFEDLFPGYAIMRGLEDGSLTIRYHTADECAAA